MRFHNVDIRGEYFGFKPAPYMENNTNYHKVFINNLDTKKHSYFEFWACNLHPKIENDKDLLVAFQNFLEDAMAGDMEYEQFCQEYGYDIYRADGYPNANAKRIWRSCKNARAKFDKIFEGINLYEAYNEVSDMIRKE